MCCVISQKNITQTKAKMPLRQHQTQFGGKCSSDIISPLSKTLDRYKYLLTFQDEV
jgi:hypothetical protein